MKRAAAILFVIGSCLLGHALIPPQVWVTIIWEYTNTTATADCFYIYYTTNMLQPLPWTVLTNAPGTNRSVTVLIKPDTYFFYGTASNMWGESGPSNQIGTPAPVSNPTNLTIRH